MEFFAWIEQSAVGLWVRESPTVWAFPFVLILHTVGLAIVGGTATILNVLAFSQQQQWQPKKFEPWFQFAWLGFAINLVSGVLLLAAYPAKALTNPVFYAKLICVIGAMIQLQWLRHREAKLEASGSAAVLRRSAIAAFVLWGLGIWTGRFLAYTHRYLMSSDMMPGLG